MAMQWAMDNPAEAAQIAANAYLEVRRSHLVDHRIDQILEVFNA
jgi:spore maturation protein CgeB